MFRFYMIKLLKRTLDDFISILKNTLIVDYIDSKVYIENKNIKFCMDIIYTDDNGMSYYACISDSRDSNIINLKRDFVKLLVNSFTKIKDIENIYKYPFSDDKLIDIGYIKRNITEKESEFNTFLIGKLLGDMNMVVLELPKFNSSFVKKKCLLTLGEFEKELSKRKENINNYLEKIEEMSIIIAISELNELFEEAIKIIDESEDWIKYKSFLDCLIDIDKALVNYLNLNEKLQKVELSFLEGFLEESINTYSNIFK